MRASGRAGSERVFFIAPAAIFGGFFIWMYGSPLDAVTALDRMLLRGIHWMTSAATAAVQALGG